MRVIIKTVKRGKQKPQTWKGNKEMEVLRREDYTTETTAFIDYRKYLQDYSEKAYKISFKNQEGKVKTEYIPKSAVDESGNIAAWVCNEKNFPRVMVDDDDIQFAYVCLKRAEGKARKAEEALKDDDSEEARESFKKAVDYIEVKKQKIADIIKSVTDRIVTE